MAFIFNFPARILGHISALLLGDYQRDEHGHAVKKRSFPGVLGLLLGGIELFTSALRSVGLTITHVLKSTESTLNAAFWLALFLGGAAALTVACWPAALALVVNYSIVGYSIAALVGTEFAAQVLATGAVAALLSTLSVFSLSAMGHSAWWLVSCCCGSKNETNEQGDFDELCPEQNYHSSARKIRLLGEGSQNFVTDECGDTAHYSPLFKNANNDVPHAADSNDDTNTISSSSHGK